MAVMGVVLEIVTYTNNDRCCFCFVSQLVTRDLVWAS